VLLVEATMRAGKLMGWARAALRSPPVPAGIPVLAH